MFFKSSNKAEDVKDSVSNYINKSGAYPVTLLAPIVNIGAKGAVSVDMFVEHNGQPQVIYGNLRITNNDGSVNKIGNKLFNQLLVVAGVEEVAEPVDMELPVGRKGADKSSAVLEDLMGVEVIMRVQMEYSAWKGDIKESKNIRGFFRASDNASAEEIVQDKNFGKSFEGGEKYNSNVTYNDGMTEEKILEWIADKRPKGTAGSRSNATKAPSFTKKRFGNKE